MTYESCIAEGGEGANISQTEKKGPVSLLDTCSLLLPNLETLNKLMGSLNESLDDLYSENDISKYPPVQFDYDFETNQVRVKGDREDKDKISELINSNPQLKEEIRTTLAIASHVVNMADSIKFSEEYMASDNPEAVVSKYSYLFNDNRKMKEVSLIYGAKLSAATEDGSAIGTSDGTAAAASDATDAEKEKIEKLLERIRYLMQILFIRQDPEEAGESDSGSGGGGTQAASKSEDDPEVKHQKLLQEIARKRDEAVKENEDNSNQYAFAIESYSIYMHRVQSGAEQTGTDADADSAQEDQTNQENQTVQA